MTMGQHLDIHDDEEELNDRDWLVQRFVDQDLLPQERIEFLREMDRDPILRRQVLATEQILLQATQLPRTTASVGLKEQVLQQLLSSNKTNRKWWESAWSMLFAPRVLEWNPAIALTAACLLVGVLWMIKPSTIPDDPTVTPPTAFVKTRESGDAQSLVMVRLVLLAPQAQSVAVAGDFNGWKPEETPLQPTEGGAWTVTLQVHPGRYHYMFVVDDESWVTDPFAGEYSADGFGAKNAILDVSHVL